MQIRPETPLKEIANAGDAARQILERAGLDFCCDGDRSLRDACENASVDIGPIETALSTLPPPPSSDWHRAGISALLEHILDACHPETERRLAALEAAAKTLEHESHDLQQAIEHLTTDARSQMNEEESCYFARVRSLANARKGRGPFPLPPFRTIHDHERDIRQGHARTHEQLRRVRELAASLHGRGAKEFRRAIDSVSCALVEQMHLENNALLPRARDLEPNGHQVERS